MRPWEAGYTPPPAPPTSLADIQSAPTRWARTKLLLVLWLSEKTTIRGLVLAVASLVGWQVADVRLDAVLSITGSLAMGYLIVFKENRP